MKSFVPLHLGVATDDNARHVGLVFFTGAVASALAQACHLIDLAPACTGAPD